MDDEFEGMRLKQIPKEGDINLFANYESDLPPFDFEYEEKKGAMYFKDFNIDIKEPAPRSVMGLNMAKTTEVKKSISQGNLAKGLSSKKVFNRAESCMNLQDLKNQNEGKKQNSKNIFIQKIQGLLKDNTLVDKIENENKLLNDKICKSKEILKINTPENSDEHDDGRNQKDLEAITENSNVLEVDKSHKNRLSAQNTRKRKKLYIDLLEAKVEHLEAKNKELTAKLAAQHDGEESVNLSLRRNQSRDSVKKFSCLTKQEEEWNQCFQSFSNKVKEVTTDKDILKAFHDFKVQAVAYKYEAKETTVDFIKKQLRLIQQLGVSPLLKLYGTVRDSLEGFSEEDMKYLEMTYDEYMAAGVRERQLLEDINQRFQALFQESKKNEERVTKIFKEVSKEGTARLFYQLITKGEGKSITCHNNLLSTTRPQSSRASYMSFALDDSIEEDANLGKRDIPTDDDAFEEITSKRIMVRYEDKL